MPEMARLERFFCRSGPWRAFTRRVVLPWALHGIEPKGEVLEIGGGSGAMAAGILDTFPDIRVVVTDYDESMVDAARRRLDPYGARATVERADATVLPYADQSFDAVVSFIMLHHVAAWEEALGEVVRVLRSGGMFAGYDLAASASARWLHQVQRERQRMVAITEMQARLRELPFEQAVVRPAFARLVMRFWAIKAAS